MDLRSTSLSNAYVRGSGSRGELPFDDIDILVTSPDSKFTTDGLVSEFFGRPIIYTYIPFESFYESLTSDIRSVSWLKEMIPVTHIDDEVAEIVSRAKSEITEEKLSYYLLYRMIEEEKESIYVKRGLWSEYKFLKDFPGSRRTIERIFWMSQVVYPQYGQIANPDKLLYAIMQNGLMSSDVL